MGNNFQQNILRRILRIRESAEHSQGKVKDQILHAEYDGFQRILIPGNGLIHQFFQFFVRFLIHYLPFLHSEALSAGNNSIYASVLLDNILLAL